MGSGATVKIAQTSSWGSGYCATIGISNTLTVPAASWSVTLDVSGVVVTSSWNAVTTQAGSQLKFVPQAAYGALAAGASSSAVGFCANGSALPKVLSSVLADGNGNPLGTESGAGGASSAAAGSGGAPTSGSSAGSSSKLALFEPSQGMYVGMNTDLGSASPQQFNQNAGFDFVTHNIYAAVPWGTSGGGWVLQSSQNEAPVAGLVFVDVSFPPTSALSDADVNDIVSVFVKGEASGGQFMLSVEHEMNINTLRPAIFTANFRALARAVKAKTSHTALVWVPNVTTSTQWGATDGLPAPGSADFAALDTNHDGRVDKTDDPFEPFYPGDDVVDWVGNDIYWWGATNPPSANAVAADRAFSDGIGRFYHQFCDAPRSKPMVIMETAAWFKPGGGGDELATKRSWFNQIFNVSGDTPHALDVADHFPKLKMVTWFDRNKESDWRLTANPAVDSAFTQQLAISKNGKKYFLNAADFRANNAAAGSNAGGAGGGSSGTSMAGGGGSMTAGGASGICAGSPLSAESFSHTAGNAASPGWVLSSNDRVYTQHVFTGGNTTVQVSAKGMPAAGVWPTLVVKVAGKVIGTTTVASSTLTKYPFTANLSAGSQELSLELTNAQKTWFETRSLTLNTIQISEPCGGAGGAGGAGGTGGGTAMGNAGTGGALNMAGSGSGNTAGATGSSGGGSGSGLSSCKFNYGQDWQGSSYAYPAGITYLRAWAGGGGLAANLDSNVSDLLRGCKSGGGAPGRTPLIIGYVIAYTARTEAGLQDCDVAQKQGLSTSLCTNGTQFIQKNEQGLIDKYTRLASQIAATWGTTAPILWMTEPDYLQYSKDTTTQAGGGFSYAEAGQELRKFMSAVKSKLPNVSFALDTAPWLGTRAQAWFAAMPMDMMSYLTVFGEPTDCIQGPNSCSYGNSWSQFHLLTGLPILSEGWAYQATDGNWHDPATINQLISWGVASESFRSPPATWEQIIEANAPKLGALTTCH